MSKRPTSRAEHAARDIDALDALARLNKAGRRAAYKQQAKALRDHSPADSIRRVRLGLRPRDVRRPCDTGHGGTWFADFTINAITTVLKEVELALRKTGPRQPATPRSKRRAS